MTPRFKTLLHILGVATLVIWSSSCSDDTNKGPVDDLGAVAPTEDTGTFKIDGIGAFADTAQPEDTSTTSDATENPECPPGSQCFGSACETNEDCDAYCVPHMGGKVCTKACIEECPDGFSCQAVTGFGSDTLFLCTSDHPHLCKPCVTSDSCSGLGSTDSLCMQYAGPQGRFCGAVCNDNKPCPEGYKCEELTSVEGVQGSHCVPQKGSCPCSKHAIDNALFTTCTQQSGELVCEGNRVCTETGLTPCNASSPALEICDGLDNNCNGQVDENSCNDNNDCTQDICDPKTGCQHPNKDDGLCNDGDACTQNDGCKNGACTGDPVICADDNDCTSDSCDPKTGCTTEKLSGTKCDDGSKCTTGDLCKDGKCAGTALFCEDGEPCTSDACDPATGCLFKALDGACDDGDLCTTGDTCKGSKCESSGQLKCDDNNVCTTDSCAPTKGCVYTPVPLECDDGNACTPVDQCIAGQCKGLGSVQCPLGQECQAKPGCVNRTKIWGHSKTQLFRIDLKAQSLKVIGNFQNGMPMTDIAEAQNGTLYGIDNQNLHTINKETGNASLLAKVPQSGGINGLTVAPDGTIYAGDTLGNLYIINKSNGQATNVGKLGNKLSSSGDIVWGPLSAIYVSDPNDSSDQLLTVNPATAVATPIGNIGYKAVYGLVFADGGLVGLTDSGKVIKINYTTGKGTLIFSTQKQFWGGG